mgnify:FL=1
MTNFKNFTLNQYLDVLAQRTPVPGGGSAAALTAALGAALISMVAHYSLGKGKSAAIEKKIRVILQKSERLRGQFLQLVDLDAQAYLKVVKAQRNAQAKKAALKKARAVPLEVGRRCYSAVQLTPYLLQHGNQYVISDIQVAVEFLLAAFKSAMVNVEINTQGMTR